MPTYDVFLSHHPDDLPLVKDLARRLQEEDITVFLGHWDIVPGRLVQESLEAGLTASRPVPSSWDRGASRRGRPPAGARLIDPEILPAATAA